MAIDTTDRFTSKGGPHLAAALTFFTLFSLAPLLIFVVAFAGLILGQETARAELVGQVSEVMGPEIAAQVDAIVVSTQQTASGTIAVLFGLASVAYGASRVFRGLQGGLNFMWDARPRKRNLVVGYLIDRVVSWGAAFLAGISLAATLSLFVALTASGATHLGRLINVTWLNDALGAVISLCVISVMFAAIYRFVPAVDIGWRDVLPAAGLVSAALFIGARLVGMVLGYAGPGASYLVASVPTIILIWINISAQIVYFGAAFTVIYAHRYGSLRQDDDAPEQEASRAP
jgi:membrane protein